MVLANFYYMEYIIVAALGGLFPIYKETGSGVMFVYALGAMSAVCVVCVGGGAEAGVGWGLGLVFG